ncbi:MAG TPA: hypothetical protein VJH95_05470 [Candidatus Nanoarchaeia archaeon]|nr:hypothetical protein [Candidatus Nanoarchaeia archaeon]
MKAYIGRVIDGRVPPELSEKLWFNAHHRKGKREIFEEEIGFLGDFTTDLAYYCISLYGPTLRQVIRVINHLLYNTYTPPGTRD